MGLGPHGDGRAWQAAPCGHMTAILFGLTDLRRLAARAADRQRSKAATPNADCRRSAASQRRLFCGPARGPAYCNNVEDG